MEDKLDDFSLEEWVKEIDKELSDLEAVVESPSLKEDRRSIPEESSVLELQTRLKEFFLNKDIQLGKKLLAQLETFEEKDRESQVFLKILKNLIKSVLKVEAIVSLGVQMAEELARMYNSSTSKEEKLDILNKFINEYKRLKESSPKIREEKNIHQRLIDQIKQTFEGKLHEINVKIEENQRMLHQLITAKETTNPTLAEEIWTQEQLKEKKKEISKAKFYLLKINDQTYTLSTDLVLNVYKVSSKKAQKLARKPVIKFAQLGSFLNPIHKGLKGELKNKKKNELKNMFLTVLQPDEGMGKYKNAVLVKIPDVEAYGVVFVESVELKKNISATLRGDKLETEEKSYPVLDIKSLWTKHQIEFGELE